MNPIKRLRLQKGVTQSKLALCAGTSQPTIASYEAGEKSPTLDTLFRLAESLGFETQISFSSPLTREDLRSLAYHQAIMKKLKKNPNEVILKAKQNLKKMIRANPGAKTLLQCWKIWISLPIDDLIYCAMDKSSFARDMRQVTPFAGVLTARERSEILNKFRNDRKKK